MIDESKRRLLTPIIMLTAGAIAAIILFLRDYTLEQMLFRLLLVLVLFYILGGTLTYFLIRFEEQNEAIRAAKEAEEGEVIEKELLDGTEDIEGVVVPEDELQND